MRKDTIRLGTRDQQLILGGLSRLYWDHYRLLSSSSHGDAEQAKSDCAEIDALQKRIGEAGEHADPSPQ